MNGQGYRGNSGIDARTAGIALIITALPIVGLALSNPTFQKHSEQIFQMYPVSIPEVPPPDPEPIPQPETQGRDSAPTDQKVVAPDPIVPTATDFPPIATTFDPPPVPTLDPAGSGSGGEAKPAALPEPVLAAPRPDPRYLAQFQPDYPASERRNNHEGIVVVRVLVGINGRVKAVEKVSAASDAFYQATREQALSAWRFKPATRDGLPVEQWYTSRVRFELH